MQIRSFERIGDHDSWHAVTIRQRFCNRARRLHAAILTGVGVLICTPFFLIATDQRAKQHAINLWSDAPVTAIELLVLFAIGTASLVAGLALIVRPTVSKRDIEIGPSEVSVNEEVGGANRSWREPLKSYTGMRHLVTTTSGGPTHSLVLEHRNRKRALVIANAPHIANGVIATAATGLNLPVLTNEHRKNTEISRPLNFTWQGLKQRLGPFEQNVRT